MVNLSEFEKSFYTDKELKEIDEGAALYDKMAADQLARESKNNIPKINRHAELYRLFEKVDFEELRFWTEDLALMAKIKEQCSDHETIPSWCDFHMRIIQCEIEEITGAIEYDRRQAENA